MLPGPPGSRPWHSLGWVFRPVPFLLRAHRRYGDAFTIKVGHEPEWSVLAHPDMVRDVFKADPEIARAGEGNHVLEPILGPRSVLLLDGKQHMRERKLLLPPFHGQALARHRDAMREVAEAEVSRWTAGDTFALQPRMADVTLEIIIRTVFGVRDAAPLERLRSALRDLLEEMSSPSAFLLVMAVGPRNTNRIPVLRRALQRVDAEIHGILAERRTAEDLEERDDVLSLLLRARDEDGEPMSDAELRDELLTLLVAGHETTATALSWALQHLVRDPDRLERLHAEAEGGDATFAQAVCREALRLRPVVPIVIRRLHAPLDAGGVHLPAGASAVPCIVLIHRREDVYPDPHRFVPERFVDEKPGTYTWIPFGGGVRRCIGAAFALQEMEEVLGAIARSARLRPARAAPEGVRRRTITLAPSRGAEVVRA